MNFTANKIDTVNAKAAGAKAFERGAARAPALDQEFMRITAGRQIGDKRTLVEAKAWLEGWTMASLEVANG